MVPNLFGILLFIENIVLMLENKLTFNFIKLHRKHEVKMKLHEKKNKIMSIQTPTKEHLNIGLNVRTFLEGYLIILLDI